MTEEVFNAVIAVAKAHGLDWMYPDGGTHYNLHKKRSFMLFDEVITSGGDGLAYKEIPVEDFLFSLAPDWAVDIRYFNGVYHYTDSVGKYVVIGGSEIYEFNLSGFKIIATRKQEQWQPKVGGECLVKHNGDWHETFIVGISSYGNYFYESSKFAETVYDGNNITCFKPLPEPTEEEKLIDIAKKDNDDLVVTENFTRAVSAFVKAGYCKVEPISREMFLHQSLILDTSNDDFSWLAENNHIVVKKD